MTWREDAGSEERIMIPPASEPTTMDSALALIRAEHEALAKVLHGLDVVTHDVSEYGAKPDFDLLATMLYYIDQFPERCHHPKEEAFLFARVRERTRDADTILEALQSEHRRGERLIADLALKLVRYQGGGQAELAPFAAAVAGYLEFSWNHMRTEEDLLLPIAQRVLSPADWDAIDAAFRTNDDPMFGRAPSPQYTRLYTRIVNLAPRKLWPSLRLKGERQ